MSPDLRISNLCCLIDRTVDRYTINSRTLKKEEENDLLVTLSQVSTEIRLWTRELDRGSDSDAKFCVGSKQQHEDHNCLSKVLSELMVLIGAESQYLRHLAGNVLESVSEFVAVSGSVWDTFIGLLCNYLRLAIKNVLSNTEVSSVDGAEDWNEDLPSFGELELELKNANLFTIAGAIRVLRDFLKYLEQEDADQLLEVYLNSVGSFLSNFPWDYMDKVFLGQISCICEIDIQNDHLPNVFLGHACENEPKVLLLGNLLQLLCSLVEQAPTVEAEVGSQDQHPYLCVIINSMPKILRWFLGKPGSVEVPINQYFRHKLLVLMLRLTYNAHLSCSTTFSWLKLLHDYFEELLQRSIVHIGSSQDDCLEGSPFSLGLYGGKGHGTHSLHLQRQAVFLLLSCCFNLISLTGETNRPCASETSNCLTFDSVPDLDSCRKKGSSELYKWLQCHISTEMFLDYETYSEKCIGFVLSFLRLYMHEDDLLFKMLLQLLSIPFYSEQQLHGEKFSLQNVKDNILVHVSKLFNPICLFHLFLAELRYDHQVLLDYLISTDTGTSCAEYLLRSLRTGCNSWNLFKNFSMDGKVATDSSFKKRKLWLDDCQAQPSSVPSEGIPSSVEEECKRDYEHDLNHSKSKRNSFKEAKDCLLSLKSSVENLHWKNLFPYNPKVILKRLSNFQELCLNLKN